MKEVKIGNQIWMTENLNVDKFRNGDSIPQAKTNEEWKKAGDNNQPAWCYYDNNFENGDKYGKLYNFYAVNDFRGLAPRGFHIPSNIEWKSLVTFLGEGDIASIMLKAKFGWNNNGSNESGFLGIPGGYRSQFGDFVNIGKVGQWWSTTKYFNDAWNIYISQYNGPVYIVTDPKGKGFSVRCIRD